MSLEQVIRKDYDVIIAAGDFHIPFEDKKATSILKQYLKERQPDTLIFNGDFLDCYSLSKFTKDPSRITQLQDDINYARKELRQYRKLLPNADIYYMIKGANHEERLQKYLWSKAPELAKLEGLRIEKLLELDELGIKPITDRIWISLGNELLITHGDLVRKFSGYSAKGMFDKHGKSILMNHTHRLGAHYHRNATGMHAAFENGCMCDLNPEYIFNPDWQQGFSIIYKKKGKNRFYVEQVPIIDGVAIIEGKEYRG